MVTEPRDAYALKETVQFTCADDKIIDGDRSSINCQENGFFSNFAFECKDICDDPPVVPLARPILEMDQYPVDSAITYKCTNGNNMPLGDATLRCNKDGKWSTPAFSCQSACHAPMRMSDSIQVVVQADGSETELTELSNGQQHLFAVDAEVRYKCVSGFTFRNPKRIPTAICLPDGRWRTVSIQKCRKGCRHSEAPAVLNAREMGYGRSRQRKGDRFYHHNEKIHFLCKRGFKSVQISNGKFGKPPTLTCLADGWSQPKTKCIPARRNRRPKKNRG